KHMKDKDAVVLYWAIDRFGDESLKKCLLASDRRKMSYQDWEMKRFDDICTVCHDDLFLKRELHAHPCNHAFHRTCFLKWMETRETPKDQLCPNCRQAVLAIRNHHGSDSKFVAECLGESGRPTKNYVLRDANVLKMQTEDYINMQHKQTMETLKCVQADYMSGRKGKSSAYLEDCESEMEKLEQRMEIYNEMYCVFMEGGMQRHDSMTTAWNYRDEMTKIKTRKLKEKIENLECIRRDINTLQSELQAISNNRMITPPRTPLLLNQ
ncbi:hypothetical protein PENTCL1PPCAC_5298, partial [Pristionchus entomophagus]